MMIKHHYFICAHCFFVYQIYEISFTFGFSLIIHTKKKINKEKEKNKSYVFEERRYFPLESTTFIREVALAVDCS